MWSACNVLLFSRNKSVTLETVSYRCPFIYVNCISLTCLELQTAIWDLLRSDCFFFLKKIFFTKFQIITYWCFLSLISLQWDKKFFTEHYAFIFIYGNFCSNNIWYRENVCSVIYYISQFYMWGRAKISIRFLTFVCREISITSCPSDIQVCACSEVPDL